MGYWGSKSFENDYALNILGDFAHELSTEIEKRSGNEHAAQYDEWDCDKLIVDMEIYLALHAQKLPMENFPNPEILIENRPKFKAAWKEYTKSDPDFDDRLKEIMRLWKRVIKVTTKLHKKRKKDEACWEPVDPADLPNNLLE